MALYDSVSITGYNATPPSDAGATDAENRVTWAKEKEKLADPLKTAIEAINTKLVTAFGLTFSGAALQTFTSSGTYTPTAGMKYCIALIVGGGGPGFTASGGSYGGGGGGSGETAMGIFTAADIGVSQTVTIGAGGAPTNNGGTTSIGTLLTAVGGTKASSGLGGGAGTGGTGTGLHIKGGDGESAAPASGTPTAVGGHGGASFWGGGGLGGQGNVSNGAVGKAYGSGGGGNGYTGGAWSTAGSGADGVAVIIELT